MKGITVVNLLTWKPLIKKINPEKIGYVCENGQINFQTTEAADEFTKNTIVNALKKGFERWVISKDNKILFIKDGTKDKVSANFSEMPKIAGCTDSHGHPGGATFSRTDILDSYKSNKVFGYNKFKVYNINGESCTLTLEGKPVATLCEDGYVMGIKNGIKFMISRILLNAVLKFIDYLIVYDKNSTTKGFNQIKQAISKKQIELPPGLKEAAKDPISYLYDTITAHKYYKYIFNIPGKTSFSSDYNYVKPFENSGPGWT